MTPIVRSIEPEQVSAPDHSGLPHWQLRFLLRKLSLRRGEHVILMGTQDLGTIEMLALAVGSAGKVTLLAEPGTSEAACQSLQRELSLLPQVHVVAPGPSLDTQQCDAICILPERLTEPYEPLMDQSWRRLGNGGRLMLTLPHGEGNQLHSAIECANQKGFVTRYRRNCDKHCAWVGVKYAAKW
ncbi:hypothetical protein [Ferrimonas balearica]|uniref:hypothetical protein n=1 Tax=Ferrimonas balearica TaxID=44012 RepID=UPI001C992352|nr:hypothetical protein [Ferrimonas balearica]MBY5921990.1 hypothetical protein [Ferrimonas balearica]MBY5994670.1 hypothetical protein [Ferrimonas balearica]